jgi:hypothetical protein
MAAKMNKYKVTVEVEAPSKADAQAQVLSHVNPYDKEPVKLYDPQWIKVKGVDVIALPELPDIVAVPTNGRANSARFDIVDLAAGAVLTQLLKSEVRRWLIAKARSAAQDADMPVYAEEETPVEVVEDRQLPLFNARNPSALSEPNARLLDQALRHHAITPEQVPHVMQVASVIARMDGHDLSHSVRYLAEAIQYEVAGPDALQKLADGYESFGYGEWQLWKPSPHRPNETNSIGARAQAILQAMGVQGVNNPYAHNPITPYKSASERMMERPDIPPVPYFKLYSAPLRSRLAIRAPMLEASSEDISELKRTGVWKYQPSVITDEMGNIVFDNGVG